MNNLKNKKLDAIEELLSTKDDAIVESLESSMTREDWQLRLCYLRTLNDSKENEQNVRTCINLDTSLADIFEFAKSLEKFEVEEITISHKSSALMADLDGLVKSGWKIDGMVQLTTVQEWFGSLEAKQYPALKLTK